MKQIHLFQPAFRVEECLNEIRDCLEHGWTGLGYKTLKIEEEWKKYTGFQNAHFLNSSTSGLFLALEMLRDRYSWNENTEIITTPLTFISTNHAILHAGLTPVFADIDDSLNLSPLSIRKSISPNTKAIIFVGIGGNPDNYQEVLSICRENGLLLILDAAHMAGTCMGKNHLGQDSDVAIFSFQAVKNMPTGDSGMICFKDYSYDQEARQRSWLGIDKDTYSRTNSDNRYKWEYVVDYVSNKYHGNSVMASLALVSLRYLEEDNFRRREISALYETYLKDLKGISIIQHCTRSPNCTSSRHLFQIAVDGLDRNFVMSELNKRSIFPGVHYRSNQKYKPYRSYGQDCPQADYYSEKLISLPLHVRLDNEDVKRVADCLVEVVDGHGAR